LIRAGRNENANIETKVAGGIQTASDFYGLIINDDRPYVQYIKVKRKYHSVEGKSHEPRAN